MIVPPRRRMLRTCDQVTWKSGEMNAFGVGVIDVENGSEEQGV